MELINKWAVDVQQFAEHHLFVTFNTEQGLKSFHYYTDTENWSNLSKRAHNTGDHSLIKYVKPLKDTFGFRQMPDDEVLNQYLEGVVYKKMNWKKQKDQETKSVSNFGHSMTIDRTRLTVSESKPVTKEASSIVKGMMEDFVMTADTCSVKISIEIPVSKEFLLNHINSIGEEISVPTKMMH